MPLMISCGGCKRKLRIPDTLMGKVVKCPHCAHKSRIPVRAKTKVGVAQSTAKAASAKQAASKTAAKTAAAPSKKVQEKTGVAKKLATTTKPAPPKPVPSRPTPASIARPTPPPQSTEETLDDTDEMPPPPPPKPPVKPTFSSPPRPAKRDNAPVATSMLVVLGGAFIGIFVVAALFMYLFFGDAPLSTVSGTVTLDGQPLENATITFLSDDEHLRPYNCVSDANGKFSISGKGLGIPPGKYKICAEKFVMPDGKLPVNLPNTDDLKQQGVLRNALHDRYSSHAETTLRQELKAGKNDNIKISLDSQ